MNSLSINLNRKQMLRSGTFNLLSIVFIYMVPTFSHWLNFPLYLADPMRIVLVLAMVHSSRFNSYIIALTLPLFSFAIASHPVLIKSFIMAAELSLNVFLFYFLIKKFNNNFWGIVLSILISKLFYYTLKYGMIKFSFLDSALISTPVYIQLAVMFVLSTYLWILFPKTNHS